MTLSRHSAATSVANMNLRIGISVHHIGKSHLTLWKSIFDVPPGFLLLEDKSGVNVAPFQFFPPYGDRTCRSCFHPDRVPCPPSLPFCWRMLFFSFSKPFGGIEFTPSHAAAFQSLSSISSSPPQRMQTQKSKMISIDSPQT